MACGLRVRGELRPAGWAPDIKAEKSLAEMVLVKNSRLSVQPVRKAEFDKVLKMAGHKL